MSSCVCFCVNDASDSDTGFETFCGAWWWCSWWWLCPVSTSFCVLFLLAACARRFFLHCTKEISVTFIGTISNINFNQIFQNMYYLQDFKKYPSPPPQEKIILLYSIRVLHYFTTFFFLILLVITAHIVFQYFITWKL